MSRNKAEENHRRAIKRVLTTNYADLANLIEVSSPRSVGKQLITKRIVAKNAFKSIEHLDDLEKFATRLLEYAMPTLEFESAKFRTFVELLFQLTQCETLASKICHEMKEEGYPDYLNLIPPEPPKKVQSDTDSKNGQVAPGSAHSSPGSGSKNGAHERVKEIEEDNTKESSSVNTTSEPEARVQQTNIKQQPQPESSPQGSQERVKEIKEANGKESSSMNTISEPEARVQETNINQQPQPENTQQGSQERMKEIKEDNGKESSSVNTISEPEARVQETNINQQPQPENTQQDLEASVHDVDEKNQASVPTQPVKPLLQPEKDTSKGDLEASVHNVDEEDQVPVPVQPVKPLPQPEKYTSKRAHSEPSSPTDFPDRRHSDPLHQAPELRHRQAGMRQQPPLPWQPGVDVTSTPSHSQKLNPLYLWMNNNPGFTIVIVLIAILFFIFCGVLFSQYFL